MSSSIQMGSIVKLKIGEKGVLEELVYSYGYNKNKHLLRAKNISKESRSEPGSFVVYLEIIDAHTKECIKYVNRGYFMRRFMLVDSSCLDYDKETSYYTDLKTIDLVSKINVLWERQDYFKIHLTSKRKCDTL